MSKPRDKSNAPPKPPSLKQKRYIDSLARQLGFADGQAFMRAWAGKDRRGLVIWTARTVHLAINEAKQRLHQPDASSSIREGHTKRSGARAP